MKISVASRSWRRSLSWALALGSIVLAQGCSQAPAPQPAGTASTAADAPSGPAEETGEAGSETERVAATDEEREWLVDDAGRPYYVKELEKHEGYYRRLEDGRVRLSNGLTFTLEGETETTFLVRIYETSRRRPPEAEPPADEGTEPRDESPQLESTDRLQLAPAEDGLPRRGQWRNGFELADMNGDGRLDIVHGPARKGRSEPAIFLGRSDGRWERWREVRFSGPRLDYGDVAVADFDGDGHQDVAFGVHLRGLRVFVGDGEGAFEPWSEGIDYRVPGGGEAQARFSSRSLEAADWNGDGRPDLLALGEGPQLTPGRPEGPLPGAEPSDPQVRQTNTGPVLFLNGGDGTWMPRPIRGGGAARHFGDDLALGDLNGDGRTDFVVASLAAGKLDVIYLRTEDGGWRLAELAGVPEGSLIQAVEVADLDGDALDDIAVGYLAEVEGGGWQPRVDLLLNRSGGRADGERGERGEPGEWERHPLLSAREVERIWSLAAGDLDGDGDRDLVAFDSLGVGHLFLNELGTEGRFVRERSPELASSERGCRGYHARIADLDGDGAAELVAGFAGETGSETMFGEQARCRSGGELRVWKRP